MPGCVHTDLLAAGLIPTPTSTTTRRALAWMGRTDWRYETDFALGTATGHERTDLVCDGLDTVADDRAQRRRVWRAPRTCTAPTGSTWPALLRPGANRWR